MISFAKKFLSIALALVLLVGVFPAAAFAAGAEPVTHTITVLDKKDGATLGSIPGIVDGEYLTESHINTFIGKRGINISGKTVKYYWNSDADLAEKRDVFATPILGDFRLVMEISEPAHVHEYKFDHKIPATCTEAGKIVNKCSCGEEQIVNDPDAPKLEHDYSIPVESTRVPGDCVTEGYVDMKCSRCDDIKPHVSTGIDKSVHKGPIGDWETAKNDETKEVRKCQACGDVIATRGKDGLTVSFKTGRTDVAAPASIIVYDGKYPEMKGVKAVGVKFVGWRDESGNLVSKGDDMKGISHTLKADWDVMEYTVRFMDKNGDAIPKYTQPVMHGDKIGDYPSVSVAGSVEGKYPARWSVAANTEITADVDVYPEYKNNTYTVTFDYGRSKLENQSFKVENGTRIAASLPGDKLPKKSSTKEVFMYWVDPNGKRISNESLYNYGEDVTMKAVWKTEAVVKVYFYRNGNFTNPIVATLPGIGEDEVVSITKAMLTDLYNNNAYPVEMVGPFSEDSWIRYKAGASTATLDQINTVQGDANGTILYCMVKDNKSNSKPDSSNPKTGDESMILATTTVMLISAGALAVFFANRKRRNG